MGEHTFDLIICDDEVDSGLAEEVLQYLEALRRATPVVVIAEHQELSRVVEVFKAGVADYVLADMLNTEETQHRLLEVIRVHHARQALAQERERFHQANYEALRKALSKANHDINNPLAIVSGNAQLLLEIGRMMNLDADLMRPIEDIEEASQRLADLLRTVARIRDTVPHASATFGL